MDKAGPAERHGCDGGEPADRLLGRRPGCSQEPGRNHTETSRGRRRQDGLVLRRGLYCFTQVGPGLGPIHFQAMHRTRQPNPPLVFGPHCVHGIDAAYC